MKLGLYEAIGAVAAAPLYLAYAPVKVGKQTWRWADRRYKKQGSRGELKAWALSRLAKYSSAVVCVGCIILILPLSFVAAAVWAFLTFAGLMIMGLAMEC